MCKTKKSGRKKNRVSGVLHVRFDRNKNESISLSTLSCVGVCTKVEEEKNLNIDIEFANFAEIKVSVFWQTHSLADPSTKEIASLWGSWPAEP